MSNSNPVPLSQMLARAARFSRWLDMSSKDRAFAALEKSSALARADAGKLTFDDSPGERS